MKTLIFFLSILVVGSLQAQTINFNIEGVIQKPKNAKYTYLVSNSNKANGNDDLFMVTPLKGNKFKIAGKSNLNGQLLRKAFVFLDESGTITLADVKSKIKQKAWFVGSSANLKSVYLEDAKFDMENPYNIKDAKIISGGTYLNQSEEFMLALRNRKILGFVKKNPDSPAALLEIDRLLRLFEFRKNRLEADFSSPTELFSALSPRLKNTKQGIALKQKIEKAKKK